MPPFTFADALPLVPPWQLTLLIAFAETVNWVGCVMVMESDAVQPFLSVTVMVYVPALSEEADDLVFALLHTYL